MWIKGGMGDTEYAIAFHKLVLPILNAFNPDLIIVSCGFDAACNDLIVSIFFFRIRILKLFLRVIVMFLQ